MTALSALLVPMVLAAVLVFVASFLIHMMSPGTRTTMRTRANEDQLRAAPPWDRWPFRRVTTWCRAIARRATCRAQFIEKVNRVNLRSRQRRTEWPVQLGKTLARWFVFCLVVGLFAAYLTSRAFGPGTPYLTVFRFAGTTAFVGYALAVWPMSIWYRRSWSATAKPTIDGLIYGLLTGGVRLAAGPGDATWG
ncbi:MAG: hypothetical protein U0163_14415 [Gemmatimonadaceae bacterium]